MASSQSVSPPFRYAVLFCCMGNICRSPSAEGVFRAQAARAGIIDALRIDSAGTHDYHIGKAPDARSQQHAGKRGYDLTALRARQVCAADFEHFDLIVAMDHDNMELLRRQCPPQWRDKLRLMMDFAPEAGSEVVPDPYYGGADGFERVLDLIEQASAGLLRHVEGQLQAGI